MINLLQEDEKLQRIVKLLGTEALPEDQKLVVEMANLVKEVFLQQNAFDPVDAHSSPEKQIKMAKALKVIHQMWEKAFIQKGIPVSVLKGQPVITEFIRTKYEIKNEQAQMYDKIIKKIIDVYTDLISTYGE